MGGSDCKDLEAPKCTAIPPHDSADNRALRDAIETQGREVKQLAGQMAEIRGILFELRAGLRTGAIANTARPRLAAVPTSEPPLTSYACMLREVAECDRSEARIVRYHQRV